jgi:murein DD-endopeptidase MepM/ murein hydrolase activator NlpD
MMGNVIYCSTVFAQTACNDMQAEDYFKPLTGGNGARYPLTIGPLSWRLLGDVIQPVKGSDGMKHLAYALLFTNSWNRAATVKSLEVLDPARGNTSTGENKVVSIKNEGLTSKFRLFALTQTLDKANFSTELGGGQSAVAYFDVTYPESWAIAHRVTATTLDNAQKTQSFTVITPPLLLSRCEPIVLSPPFKGDGWVNGNGCCKEIGPHRFVMNSINGSLAPTEEFAIDWVRVDAQRRMFTGDFKDPKNWCDYGAELLAVAPGIVVEVVSDLPDEVAGKNPDNLTIEQIAGNRVIIDLGSRRYAEYDHMVPHSASVHVGDYVRQGQKIGLLGNSGNTDAPHLHFQLMDRPSTLDGSALPFVFDSMQLQGRITMTLDELDAMTTKNSPVPIVRKDAKTLARTMPLSLDVVGFK